MDSGLFATMLVISYVGAVSLALLAAYAAILP